MDIGKILLLGGIGYAAYEFFLKPAGVTPSAPAGGIQPASSPTPPIQNPPLNASTTAQLILNAAGPNFTMGSVDEWDYYYQKARGVPAPDPITDWGYTQESRLTKMTFPEYWAVAQSHGLSGIIPTRGMGYVRDPLRLALMEAQ